MGQISLCFLLLPPRAGLLKNPFRERDIDVERENEKETSFYSVSIFIYEQKKDNDFFRFDSGFRYLDFFETVKT